MDMTNLLVALVAALAFNEFVHLIFEIRGIRQKVTWLAARMDKQPHGDWLINTSSLTKTILLHTAMFVIFTGLSFGLLVWSGLTTDIMLLIAVVLLVITYSFTTVGMDAYHSEISKLLKRYKKQ